MGHCIYNTMISPVENMNGSPQSKNPPTTTKDNVPLGSKFLKKIINGVAAALTIVLIAIVATVTLHGDLSKSFLLYAKYFGKYVKN